MRELQTNGELTFEIFGFGTCQVGGVRQDLRHDRPASLGVAGQLHLDDDETATRLDGQEIRIAIAQLNLAADHRQRRRTGKR